MQEVRLAVSVTAHSQAVHSDQVRWVLVAAVVACTVIVAAGAEMKSADKAR